MKLNHDCVRDVLLHVEEHLSYGHFMDFSKVEIGNYSRDDLIYTADKLLEAGYLDGDKHKYINSGLPDIRISSMTWDGHQFLDNIRDDGVWKETKKVVSRFSSVSLGLIGNIAVQVISAIIRNQIGLS